MRPFPLAIGLLSLAHVAAAHLIPIPPSTCRFDPLELSVPAAGVSGTAAASTDADAFRLVFDTGAGEVAVCPAPSASAVCGPSAPRAFTLDGVDGAMVLSSRFNGALLSSGDVTTPDLPLDLTVGGVTVATTVRLTTGLVTIGDTVVAGAPIAGFGTVTLVGVASGAGLPAPVSGHDVLLRLSCQLTPNPDKDQFAVAAHVTSIGGKLTDGSGKLRATIDLNPFTPLALSDRALRVQVRAGDDAIAAATVSGGLQSARKRYTGESDDGAVSLVAQRRGPTRLVLTATLRHVTLPAQTGGARVVIGLTVDGGGLLTRGEQLFRVSRDGRSLRPE